MTINYTPWMQSPQQHSHAKEQSKILISQNYNDIIPKISIIAITDKVGGLDVLFESLKYQSFQDFELVLVDSLFKVRKDLVASKSTEYDFSIKHIEPTRNIFPISNYCNSVNTGIINACNDIVLLLSPYTYLPINCIEKHLNFHLACPASNIGFMCPQEYKILPELHADFAALETKDIDTYANQVTDSKLNHILWGTFKNTFNIKSLTENSSKETSPFSEVSSNLFNGNNVSLKTEALLKINGFNEEMDGTTQYQDEFFTNMLSKKLAFTWMTDKNNKVYTFDIGSIVPIAKTLRSSNFNLNILKEHQSNSFNLNINNYSLRKLRDKINNKKSSSHKPKMSVLVVTNRVGGLDVLFESLKKQTFQDFELILVDALYQRRKDVVSQKSKHYNFRVKHIEPIDNDFPVSNYCRSMNTGLINAEGELVYFTCDYAHLPKDTLLQHYEFHKGAPREAVLMMPVDTGEFDHKYISDVLLNARRYGTKGEDKKYQLLTVPEEVYVAAHNKWSEDYAEDIAAGKLDEVMWSIFKKEIGTNDLFLEDIIVSESKDNKFSGLSKEIPMEAFSDFVCLKNDSFKRDFVMEANGFDEIMDKSHGFQDSLFSRTLKDLYDAKFFAINSNAVLVINTRYYLEPRKVLGYNNIKIIDARFGRSQKITNNIITEFKKNNKIG